MNRMSIPEKLSVDKYELDEGHPHIEIDNAVCRKMCATKACLLVCPAGVYSDLDGEILADWAGCLECGSCRVACQPHGLHWVVPRGGFGIMYRSG